MFFRARLKANGGDREKALADSQANGCNYVPRGAETIAPKKDATPARKPVRSESPAAPAPWFSWGMKGNDRGS